jgi:MFS family permease
LTNSYQSNGSTAPSAVPALRGTSSGGRLSVLRNRNFTLLWIGQIVSNAGSWMQIVAQGILVYQLTHSPFYLGLVGTARAVPMIVLPPMGGVLADRFPRLKLLKVTQTVQLVIAFILAILISAHAIQMWHIVLGSFLSGAVNAFDQPSRQALIPDMVERDDLAKAIALNSSAWQGASLFGPALAGATVAAVGIAGAFYVNAISFIAVVLALFLMKGVPERSAAPSGKGMTHDLKAGLRYAAATRLIFSLILLSAVTSIFGRSYQQLLPAFAKDVYDQGSFGLGLLYTAPGAGAIVGAGALAVLPDIKRKGLVFLASMVLFGASLILFAVNRSFPVAILLLFVGGVFALVFGSLMTTMLQLRASVDMRGRVMSLVTVTLQGFAPLGALIDGAIATRIGTPEAVELFAVIVVVAAVVAAVAMPQVRNFQADSEGPAPPGGGHREPRIVPSRTAAAAGKTPR